MLRHAEATDQHPDQHLGKRARFAPDVIHTVAPGTPPLGHPWGLTREAPGGDGLTRREGPRWGKGNAQNGQGSTDDFHG